MNPEDIKYGLVAFDRRELEADPERGAIILHFCGYADPITAEDLREFKRTLAKTPEFGLTDKMEFIQIEYATQENIEQYKTDLINQTLTEENGKSIFTTGLGLSA
jgi:hypothetical protein